jgi:predicted house-cleaning NTP pyrophosphatase (Maf/HAM1 superfamily)
MSEEILINITPMESRVAVVENGVLQEVHVERIEGSYSGVVGLPLFETARLLSDYAVPCAW